ncbi:hypothetical protein E2C01_067879 [Portunus trituberculatus]|uniref:Uncharacterized protein n=1 Tax=Portunus trituberculatus TaxID=210409 RepID=A0A5B7HV12_PORTR|nr:hypothetical protein [Portunus trituberculatus]
MWFLSYYQLIFTTEQPKSLPVPAWHSSAPSPMSPHTDASINATADASIQLLKWLTRRDHTTQCITSSLSPFPRLTLPSHLTPAFSTGPPLPPPSLHLTLTPKLFFRRPRPLDLAAPPYLHLRAVTLPACPPVKKPQRGVVAAIDTFYNNRSFSSLEASHSATQTDREPVRQPASQLAAPVHYRRGERDQEVNKTAAWCSKGRERKLERKNRWD